VYNNNKKRQRPSHSMLSLLLLRGRQRLLLSCRLQLLQRQLKPCTFMLVSGALAGFALYDSAEHDCKQPAAAAAAESQLLHYWNAAQQPRTNCLCTTGHHCCLNQLIGIEASCVVRSAEALKLREAGRKAA
jgi:hypothetical protein